MTYNPFTITDLDPEAVGDRMAREMTHDEADAAIQRLYDWLRTTREAHAARRYRYERDADNVVTEQIDPSLRAKAALEKYAAKVTVRMEEP